VGEYWLVGPDAKRIEVLALGEHGFELVASCGEGQVLKSPLLKGLRLNLSEVF
jgi:Uma2 family endonuclease